jgi:hypothetical protein
MTSTTSVIELDTSTHSAAQSIMLHLVPGAVALAVYIAAVPIVGQLGMPTIAALAVSGLLGVMPLQLALLSRHRRQHPAEAVVQLKNRLPLPHMFGWVLLEVVLGVLAFLVTGPITRWLRAEAFGWWPESLIIDSGTQPTYSNSALAATALLMLLDRSLRLRPWRSAIFAATCCRECRRNGAAGDRWLTPRSSPGVTSGHHG